MQLYNLLAVAALVLPALATPISEPEPVAVAEPATISPVPICKPCSYFPQFPVIECFWDSCTPECNKVVDPYDRKRCIECCLCYSGCRSCVNILGLATDAVAKE